MQDDDRSKPQAKGFPIYQDRTARQVVDPASESEVQADWRPASVAAATLWRCIEALRDIQEALESTSSCEVPQKRNRRLKALAVPLVSLAYDAGKLCGHFATDPQWKDRLTPKQREYIAKLKKGLDQAVPLNQNSALREIRDRYAAHIDKKLLPSDARSILKKVATRDYGRWLHECIIVVSELLELNVYSWRADDSPPGHVRAMNVEPWVMTWKYDEKGEAVPIGLNVGASPRQAAADLCRDVVAASQWLFNENEPRLVVVEDQKGEGAA